mgnify:CR=1 FL=1
MELKFEFGGVEYSAASILEFTKEERTDFWREPFFYFYPDVDKELYNKMSDDERYKFLHDYFTTFSAENQSLIADKVSGYNSCWQRYEPQIKEALQDAFEVNLSDKFNDLVCYTTFNPISPRYLDKNSFDNFYLESEKGALGTAMHEIIHFVWFYVWQKHFKDDPAEYETPHIKWILSEMVVEPVMRDERLGDINPYYTHRNCVYSYFYTMHIDGKPILDKLYEMFSTMSIHEFMEKSYQYCVEHEEEIRKHIADNENA